MMEPSLSESLAAWLVETRARGFPERLMPVVKTYVLDWLGSVLAGTATDPGRRLLAYVQGQPDGPCHVFGARQGATPEVAALVNGGLSHIVEMDDLDRGSVTHPGAVIIPTALAVAMYLGSAGADFLDAVAAGYEVGIRVGEAVGKGHYFYFHNTSTCGVFGAAAAAAWLMGLTAEETTHAFGNAGTMAAGLWEFNTEGAMSKHLHAGRAASNGVLSALLAGHGFTGARQILEGPRGFFAALAPEADWKPVLDGLRDSQTAYKIEHVSLKPYASCRHTHPAVDAALALRARIGGQTIASVRVETYQAALDLCDNVSPRTTQEAKFSLQYCVAAALIRGAAGLRAFSPPAIADPELIAMMPRIELRQEQLFEARYPGAWPTAVVVELVNGETVRVETQNPKGDPENPLLSDEVRTKYFRMAEYGGFEAQADALADWVDALPDAQKLVLDSRGS